MKKLLLFFVFGLTVVLGFNATANINAEDIIELYPYDEEACLLATSDCTHTKVGDSNWDVTYNGYNYNVVKGNARYAADFDDANSDGFIDVTEYPSAQWTSFGGVIINDTASEVVIKTANARGDLSNGSTPRIWVYYDENGNAVMFEDNYVNKYDIHNDGDATTPDWRFATEAEVTAYTDAETALTDAQAAKAVVDADANSTQTQIDDAQAAVDAAQTAFDAIAAVTVVDSLIRLKVDATDTDGYVIEPLTSLQWYAVGVDTATDPVTDWSSIITDDPNNVVLPAGWSAFYFGYLDRDGSSNTKTFDYTGMFPEAMIDSATAPATITYTSQPGWFNGVEALDDDPATEGVNVVVDYNSTYTMPTTVEAEWLDMYDDNGKIINATEKIDYSVEISDETGLLETIDFTWNETNSVYDMSAEQTVIDTSEFGKGYTAVFKSETPEGDMAEYPIDIVIGVMPPKFVGVDDRYINENTFVDLMEGITADDGYGNDLTSSVEVTKPDDLNVYSPLPGEYNIDLEFTHHVHFDGVTPTLTMDGTSYDFDGSFNVSFTDWDPVVAVYTDVAALQANTYSWGSSGVIIEVAGDGTVIRTINRHTWALVDETHTADAPGDASAMFDDWLANLTLEADGFVAIVGYTVTANSEYADAQLLNFGDAVSYDLGEPDFDYDIVTTASYVLTVDDITPPQLLIVNNQYTVMVGQYLVVDRAILANVVAYDAYDNPDDIAVYVSDNGGLDISTPGAYIVEVTAEDMAGNSDVVTFTVSVVEPEVTTGTVRRMIEDKTLTEEQIQAMFDDQTLTEAEIQALLDSQALTAADIQALIDAAIEANNAEQATGCGSAITVGSSVAILMAALGGAVLYFSRKR